MPDSKEILDHQYLEMRWRTLSLAADLDRIQRGNDPSLLESDARIQKLRKAFALLATATPNRAEQVQMIFSDTTPPPK